MCAVRPFRAVGHNTSRCRAEGTGMRNGRSAQPRDLLPPLLIAAAQAGIGACAWAQHDAHTTQDGQHEQPSPAAHEGHTTAAMRGAYGEYSMSREASGTAWQPEAAPMDMRHVAGDTWDWMYMGFVNAVYADAFAQGPLEADFRVRGRGGQDFFAESMAMLMGQRATRGGTLALRAMLSLDPASIGDDGYPLLLQTGETSDGVTPLIDHQHPHDFFMELSASYSRKLGERSSAFVYAGLPGEPALGPVTFMHRASGMDNPDAPITHHWLDSTHITFGVLTGGVVLGDVKLEASIFNGREPDWKRYDIETENLDSWSGRVSWNPSPRWAMQVSYGALQEAERHHTVPIDVDRLTASVTHHRSLAMGRWQSTLAAGRNDNELRRDTEAFLLESALTLRNDTTVFARFESVDKDELFLEHSALHHRPFRVRKLGVGAVHDLRDLWRGRIGIGIVYNRNDVPSTLELFYGDDPDSWLVFARWRI
jgi:hypothetical protein